MASSADRNLLFGILALQMDFIKRDQLIEAMNVWALEKSKSLGQILVERDFLPSEKRNLLDPLVDAHVRDHGNDPQKSLEALSSVTPIKHELRSIADSDIQASIQHLAASKTGSAASTIHHEATADYSSNDASMRYHILRPHARGGLGEVFVANDTELDREVALKEIQLRHSANEQSRSRFVVEAQITGGLEHPGIVPVYGLGHYPDGRPFYAMRFIRGESLAEAIEAFHKRDWRGKSSEKSLELRKLLGRFVDVCQAIGYAHHRGVLHRDLKPGNVMLGKYGETLVVDWGLARILDQPEQLTADGTLPLKLSSGSHVGLTQAGSAIGTPAYMSPEQAEGKLDQVGSTSDIYSLGATLYVLLTGKNPVEGKDLGEILRKVQRGEIVAPRVVDLAIPKPLEAICLKAMALRPADRYPTCAELANDVEHWLADEPVSALSDSPMVRSQRWARKNPGPVSAIAAAVLVGLFGLAGGVYFVDSERKQTAAERDAKELARQNEKKERERAEEKEALAQKEKTEAQRQRGLAEEQRKVAKANEAAANVEKERTKRVLEFFVEAFRKPDPTMDGYKLTVASMLNQAVAQIDVKLKSDPLIQAQFLASIERTYDGLGIIAERIPIAERVRAIFEKELGPNHPKTINSLDSLAFAYKSAGQLKKAISLYLQALEKRREQLGIDHASTQRTVNNLASAYLTAGEPDKAIPLLSKSLDSLKSQFGPDHADVLTVMNNLALAHRAMGHFDESLQLLVDAQERTKSRLGPGHPLTISSMNNLALTCESIGQAQNAISLLVEAVKNSEEKLGPEHPRTTTARNNLAQAYRSSGQLEKALPLCIETLDKYKSKLGPNHPETLMAMCNLASMYHEAGKLTLAIPLFLETIQKQSSLLGSDHPNTLISMNNLANAYLSAGMGKESMELQQQTLVKLQSKLGVDHPQTLKSMGNLARSFESLGQLEKALPLYIQTLDKSKLSLGINHPDTITAMNNLATCYAFNGEVDKALPLLDYALEVTRKSVGPNHLNTLTSINNLAAVYRLAGQHDKAIPLFVESLDRTVAKFGADHPHSLFAQNNLANGYFSAGKVEKAIPLILKTLELQRIKLGPHHAETLLTTHSAANMLSMSGRQAEGATHFSVFVQSAISKYKTLPAMVQRSVPPDLDWLITYHTKQGNKAEADKYREMRKKFPAAPKKDAKVSPGKSDAKQADQKKEKKSPAHDAAKKPAPETKKVEAKK